VVGLREQFCGEICYFKKAVVTGPASNTSKRNLSILQPSSKSSTLFILMRSVDLSRKLQDKLKVFFQSGCGFWCKALVSPAKRPFWRAVIPIFYTLSGEKAPCTWFFAI
jgi:hypothetical protein